MEAGERLKTLLLSHSLLWKSSNQSTTRYRIKMSEPQYLLDRVIDSVQGLTCQKDTTKDSSFRTFSVQKNPAPQSLKVTPAPSKDESLQNSVSSEYSSNIQSGGKVLKFNEDDFTFYLGRA